MQLSLFADPYDGENLIYVYQVPLLYNCKYATSRGKH